MTPPFAEIRDCVATVPTLIVIPFFLSSVFVAYILTLPESSVSIAERDPLLTTVSDISIIVFTRSIVPFVAYAALW